MIRRHVISGMLLAAGLGIASPAAAQPRAADGVTINDEGQPQVLDLLALRDRSGDRPVRRGGDDARAVRRPRGAVGARRRRRRLHPGLDRRRVRPARPRPDGQGRRAAGGAVAAARRRQRAGIATGGRHRHEGARRGAHRQAERQLGRQPAGEELHRAGEHHGRAGGGRRGRRQLRVDRGHVDAACRADDPGARGGPVQGRRSALGQPAVGGDQDCRSERSGPRRRLHRAGDRGRRARRAGRRDEADLLHDRAPARLPHVLADRGSRRHRVEADAARARLLARVDGGISRSAAADQHAGAAGDAHCQPGGIREADRRVAQGHRRLHPRLRLYDAEAVAAVDKFRADRNLNYQGNPPGLADARLVEALRAAYLEKKRAR